MRNGAMLLAAVTTVLDRSDRAALLERTRAEIHGLTMSELCDSKGWHRGRFYRRTDAAAEQVAAYLNEHAGQDVDAVQERKPRPSLKGGQKAANGENMDALQRDV